MKHTKRNVFAALFLLFTFAHPLSVQVYAQETDSNKAKQLEAYILAHPKDDLSLSKLEELSSLYLGNHQYDQMVDFLRKQELAAVSGCALSLGYYIGLCRYHQLRYLEETKNWQEYFNRGNFYREELFQETIKEVALCPQSPLAIKAQAINWLEHKAQNDPLGKDALDKLINLINTYVRHDTLDLSLGEGKASSPGLDIEVIKETADILQREEEPALAKAMYNLYVSRLDSSKIAKEKLRLAAESALEGGNISLAEIIYERYIEGIKESFSKDDLAKELTAIAAQFCASGRGRFKDMAYAEKIFTILENSCGVGYFNEELLYARAYNFQRLKDYSKAAEEYEKLLKNFPASFHSNEAEFKLGVLYAYILFQKEKGLYYWQKVIERNSIPEGQTSSSLEKNPDFTFAVESLYHKALINQYDESFASAMSGYSKILEFINNNPDFKEGLAERVSGRQKEIQESKPLEYNLKTFLDLSLKTGGLIGSQASAFDLSVEPFKTTTGKQVRFSLSQPQTMTGCLVPEFTYLWSGDLGSAYPVAITPEFSTDYRMRGVKVVNAVVLSGLEPAGSALEMVDIDD